MQAQSWDAGDEWNNVTELEILDEGLWRPHLGDFTFFRQRSLSCLNVPQLRSRGSEEDMGSSCSLASIFIVAAAQACELVKQG